MSIFRKSVSREGFTSIVLTIAIIFLYLENKACQANNSIVLSIFKYFWSLIFTYDLHHKLIKENCEVLNFIEIVTQKSGIFIRNWGQYVSISLTQNSFHQGCLQCDSSHHSNRT